MLSKVDYSWNSSVQSGHASGPKWHGDAYMELGSRALDTYVKKRGYDAYYEVGMERNRVTRRGIHMEHEQKQAMLEVNRHIKANRIAGAMYQIDCRAAIEREANKADLHQIRMQEALTQKRLAQERDSETERLHVRRHALETDLRMHIDTLQGEVYGRSINNQMKIMDHQHKSTLARMLQVDALDNLEVKNSCELVLLRRAKQASRQNGENFLREKISRLESSSMPAGDLEASRFERSTLAPEDAERLASMEAGMKHRRSLIDGLKFGTRSAK